VNQGVIFYIPDPSRSDSESRKDAVHFTSVDHVGVVVSDLRRSTRWWTTFLGEEPFFSSADSLPETDDYVGRVLGYRGCRISVAFWALPGGAALELLEYHTPPSGRVDMETFNAGNTHLCFQTRDIRADYARMRGLADFRSTEPVPVTDGAYRGAHICYLRDPDGISVELLELGSESVRSRQTLVLGTPEP
jgi:catechol 2,3-dioxygenase-like lactoylglutathione lyase family enzyme